MAEINAPPKNRTIPVVMVILALLLLFDIVIIFKAKSGKNALSAGELDDENLIYTVRLLEG